jgi:phosphoenolpyruvate synthase/pyruvate phosphate dikinase
LISVITLPEPYLCNLLELKQVLKNFKTIKLLGIKKEIETNIIKGAIGSPGKLKGRAKILLRAEEIPKIKKGDILVAKMTS